MGGILRAIAHPFEAAGQGVKHFFTGPEYDKTAEQLKNAGTGQYGSTAPTGPMGATGGTNPFSGGRVSSFQSGPTGPSIGGPTFPSTPYGSGIGGSNSGQGMSAYEKWLLGLSIGGAALQGWAQYQNSKDSKAMSAAQLAEQGREFNTVQGQDITKRLESAPLRDRASYLLQARMGINPAPFQGASLTQQGSPGGIDPAAMAKANDAYTAGAGGTNPANDIYKKMLHDMGYSYGG